MILIYDSDQKSRSADWRRDLLCPAKRSEAGTGQQKERVCDPTFAKASAGDEGAGNSLFLFSLSHSHSHFGPAGREVCKIQHP